MREAMMIGVALAFTCLLLLFRNLLFRRRVQDPHRVYLMSHTDGHDGRYESNSSDEWPSIISAEADSSAQDESVAKDKRIELASMQDRTIRMLQ